MTQVLWERDDLYGLVVEPADRFEQTKATMRTLRSATTWGELRSAQLATWAWDLVETLTELWVDAVALSDEDEESLSADDLASMRPDDETPWAFDDDVAEMVTDRVPLSHDAHSTQLWLGRELLAAHADISGASPGGHSDGYRIRDQDAFFEALQAAGFELVHRPGFFSELLRSV